MNEDLHPKPEHDDYPPLKLTDEMQFFVYEAAKWAKMLSIFGFVMVGLIVLLAFTIGTVISFLGKVNPGINSMAGAGTGAGIVYLLMAVIYFFPTLYLYQFASKAREGINYNNEAQILESFSKLKSFFKFWGIFVIVIVAFYTLIIALAIIGGVGVLGGMK